MSHLDARQSQALAQLRDLTNGGDDDVAISVLDSVGWDVQVGFCSSDLSSADFGFRELLSSFLVVYQRRPPFHQ
jgi:hypothetical protein